MILPSGLSFEALEQGHVVDLGLVAAVELELVFEDPDLRGDLRDGLHGRRLGDLDVLRDRGLADRLCSGTQRALLCRSTFHAFSDVRRTTPAWGHSSCDGFYKARNWGVKPCPHGASNGGREPSGGAETPGGGPRLVVDVLRRPPGAGRRPAAVLVLGRGGDQAAAEEPEAHVPPSRLRPRRWRDARRAAAAARAARAGRTSRSRERRPRRARPAARAAPARAARCPAGSSSWSPASTRRRARRPPAGARRPRPAARRAGRRWSPRAARRRLRTTGRRRARARGRAARSSRARSTLGRPASSRRPAPSPARAQPAGRQAAELAGEVGEQRGAGRRGQLDGRTAGAGAARRQAAQELDHGRRRHGELAVGGVDGAAAEHRRRGRRRAPARARRRARAR